MAEATERAPERAVMDELHAALGRRLEASSQAPCPVEYTAAYVKMCATQSCGKCTPGRIGLRALADLLDAVLEGRADGDAITLIERTAQAIYLSADCAVGREAGGLTLEAVRSCRDDFEHHIALRCCGCTQDEPPFDPWSAQKAQDGLSGAISGGVAQVRGGGALRAWPSGASPLRPFGPMAGTTGEVAR